MNDFQGLLSGEYGLKTQGKSAPMAPPGSNPSAASSAFDFSIGGPTTAKAATYSKTSVSKGFVGDDDIFRRSNSERNRKPNGSGNVEGLDGVFGGGFKSTDNSSVNFDSVSGGMVDSGLKFSYLPVLDKPVYDDEAFDSVSGLKSSSSANYEDIFTSSTSSSNRRDAFDDLLGDLGRKKPESKSFGGAMRKHEKNSPAFDDLLPGFGPSRSSSDRPSGGWAEKPTGDETRKGTGIVENPSVVLSSSSPDAPTSPGRCGDPLEQCSNLNCSSTRKPAGGDSDYGIYDVTDPVDSLGEPVHVNDKEKAGRLVKTEARPSWKQASEGVEATKDRPSFIRSTERCPEKKLSGENFEEYSRYDTSSVVNSSSCKNGSNETTSHRYTSFVNEDNVDLSDDVWLTVSEIPLLTQPTAAPPPSRPPPPRPPRVSKAGAGFAALAYAKKKVDDHSPLPTSARHFQSPKSAPVGVEQVFASPIDGLEEFAKGRNWSMPDENSGVLPGEGLETNTDAAESAAAMKEAVDRAEARFKHAKEVRERENAKVARMQQEKREKTTADLHEGEFSERMERQQRERQLREEVERKKRKEEERLHKEREEGEREQRKIERDRTERAQVGQAAERATREARARAAAEAHSRAEKAAVGKVQAEARERAERAAVLRAQAEARERAARAAAGAKQRADRENAERAAREKAEREAREKEACDRVAAASTRAYQQKNENDLESFFNMGPRASSNPRPSASSSDPFFDSRSSNNQAASMRSSVGSAANMRKASLPTSFFDDLNSILGGSSTPWEFQEVEGETEERRKARLARQQRTQERADKAVAEKNQRDLDAQREQAERHRISETLDVEIKRWAAGKEGNLRALLSTLQYVLWPECGWQPVSLTNLISAAAVKKVYRKATLCIHPDKVQQKGATLQQKYIAEKVFDILKESWNKFNSEELF